MRFGFYLNGPGSYAHVDPADGLKVVAAAGFQDVDVSASMGIRAPTSSAFTKADRAALRHAAREQDLGIAAVVTHLGLSDSIAGGSPLDLRGAVDVAIDLGAPLVLVHIGARSPSGADPDELRRGCLARVRDAADSAAPHDIAVCLDAVASEFLTRDVYEVRDFLGDVARRNVGWNFDPAYLAAYAVDASSAIDVLGPWIRHAHLKDYRRSGDRIEWLIPGDGDLDTGGALHALERIGFTGTVAAEVIARVGGGAERWPISHAATLSYETMRLATAGRAAPATDADDRARTGDR